MTEPQPDPAAPETPPGQPPPEQPRVLRRSRDDRVVGGVAGGLGRYFGVDPILLRIAFVLLVFAGGSGLLLYVLGWVLIPEEKPGEAVGPAATAAGAAIGSEAIGLILVALGGFLLLRLLVPDLFAARYIWPVVLIVIGLALLLRGARR